VERMAVAMPLMTLLISLITSEIFSISSMVFTDPAVFYLYHSGRFHSRAFKVMVFFLDLRRDQIVGDRIECR